MRTNATTALGIDIGEDRISLVFLGKTKEGLRVLNAARVPMPEGTIEGGRVMDETLLLKALKEARRCNRTRTQHIALSLPVASTVSRVVRLDEEDPQRIAEFVRDEISEFAAFSGRETVSDFRVVTPARHNAPGKVFLSASDHHTVTAATQACRRAGFGVRAIESPGMACARAVGCTGAASKSSNRLLVAVLKGGVLSLCVFRRGIVDFVRTDRTDKVHREPGEVQTHMVGQINALIGYYEDQNDDVPEPWSVITIIDDDDMTIRDDDVRSLKADVTAEAVDVWAKGSLSDRVSVDPQVKDDVSVAALGLAMRFLIDDEHDSHVNLLPLEATRDRSTRKSMLIAANMLASFMLIVILIMGGLRLLTKRVNQDIAALQEGELRRGQHGLSAAASQLAYIEQRSESLTSELTSLGRVSESHLDVQWVQLLDDIKSATPVVLCVTNLTVDSASDLFMEGLSHSYEAVHIFVEMLSQSEQIQKASIIEAVRSMSENGLVQYTIRCTLTSGKAV